MHFYTRRNVLCDVGALCFFCLRHVCDTQIQHIIGLSDFRGEKIDLDSTFPQLHLGGESFKKQWSLRYVWDIPLSVKCAFLKATKRYQDGS